MYFSGRKEKVVGTEQSPESFERQRQRALLYLKNSFETLFKAEGGNYARHDEEAFSGDGASIYVLVSMKNEKGEEIPELVKVGWGEFSKKTFEGDQYPIFKNFPFDIYCVSQSDSYFASEKLKEEMAKYPIKYLSEHSLFVATNGQVHQSEKVDFETRSLNRDIKPVPYDEMLRTVRNQIINTHTTPEEFAAFLQELPDDPDRLGEYVRSLERVPTKIDARKEYLMHLLWGMGIERVGAAIGDKKAMESILQLKRQFDFKTRSFK